MVDSTQIDTLVRGIDVCQERLIEMQGSTSDPQSSAYFASLFQQLEKGKAYMLNQYANDIDAARKRIQKAKDRADSVLQNTKAMAQQQQAEAAAAKQAAEAAAAELPKQELPPIDPSLGAKLRKELLERFAPSAPAESNAYRLPEIWEDWDSWRN